MERQHAWWGAYACLCCLGSKQQHLFVAIFEVLYIWVHSAVVVSVIPWLLSDLLRRRFKEGGVLLMRSLPF